MGGKEREEEEKRVNAETQRAQRGGEFGSSGVQEGREERTPRPTLTNPRVGHPGGLVGGRKVRAEVLVGAEVPPLRAAKGAALRSG